MLTNKQLCVSLCNCKFQNELNNDKLDDIYKSMIKKLKKLSNKQKDKEYLMLMEDFNKHHYEQCERCIYREYSNYLILSSKKLQSNLKNIIFKKYRKSPKQDDNMIVNFLYNICYDGIKQIHYPIYLINSLLHIFNQSRFYERINSIDCITDDNKVAKRTSYIINPAGTDILISDKKTNFESIKTYSFQYPNDKPKKIINYDVEQIFNYKTKFLYNAYYHNGNYFLYRIRVKKIYKFYNNTLPFKDIFCLLFYDDKLLRKLCDFDNILLELKIEVINIGKEDYKYIKKIDYKKIKKEQHKHLLLPEFIDKSLKDIYIVNQDGINLFDKALLTDNELNDLFNPKTELKKEKNNNCGEITPHVIIRDIIDNSSDDNSSDDNSSDDNSSDDNINDEISSDDNINEPLYAFSYNKFIEFTDYDKEIIENSILNKLKENIKMKLLFNPYNTINIIKNLNKSYSKQNYFNVILFNTDTKILSNQYHIYLDDDNNIKTITEINNLLD